MPEKKSISKWLLVSHGVDIDELSVDERLTLLDEIYDGLSVQELRIAHAMVTRKLKDAKESVSEN